MPVKQQAGVRACCRLRDTREMTNIFLNIPVCEATPAGSPVGVGRGCVVMHDAPPSFFVSYKNQLLFFKLRYFDYYFGLCVPSI